MTNLEKQELRQLAEQGLDFKAIRKVVDCADSTIKQYIKVFAPPQEQDSEADNG